MQMRRYVAVIVAAFCLLVFAAGVSAAPLTVQDKEQLKWLFGMMETSINQGDSQGIINLFSPNMPQDRRTALSNDIYARIAGGGIKVSFFPNLSDESIKEISPGILYEVSGSFKAEGPQWNVSGLSATFTVERVGYYFYIYDTNMLEKMGPEAVFKTVGTRIPYYRGDLPGGHRRSDHHCRPDYQKPEKEEGGSQLRRGAGYRIGARENDIAGDLPDIRRIVDRER